MLLKNLNFKKFQSDARNFKINDSNSYIESYQYFLEYFSKIDRIDKDQLIIGAHIVYGWMPTILTMNLSNIDDSLSLLNEVKRGHELNVEEYESLKPAINNSMVGLSKFLHFLNPKHYAIWDSRIFRYLTEIKSTHRISNPTLYINYLAGIKEISEHIGYHEIHSNIETEMNYKLHYTRAIEIVMFETDRNSKK